MQLWEDCCKRTSTELNLDMREQLHAAAIAVIAFCVLTRTVWNAVLDRVVICTCMFEIGLVRVLALISSTLKPAPSFMLMLMHSHRQILGGTCIG